MANTLKKVNISSLMEQSGVKFGTSGIRGLVSNMTDELCFAYTIAFANALNIQSGTKVAIGVDLRPSSIRIASNCFSALNSIGVDVEFCGELPTPALAYYAEANGLPAIMVTGSHIPYDRNGIKFYSAQGEITKEQELSISNNSVDIPLNITQCELPSVKTNASKLYKDRYLNFLPNGYLSGLSIGFYQHSSVARDLLTDILQSLGANVIPLGRTDEFTPIDTEAVDVADVERAHQWAAKFSFDAIISTDGDGDRPLVGDENGDWMRGDIVGLLTSMFLKADVVVTPVSSNTAIEKSKLFNQVIRTRIGSPFVIEAMLDSIENVNKTVIGFEANGGVLLGTDFYSNSRLLAALRTRDATLPIICILALSKELSLNLSKLSTRLPNSFTSSSRIKNFSTEKSFSIIDHLKNNPDSIEKLLGNLSGEHMSIDTTDGLRVSFKNGEIIHYRPSGNAPELRCYAESESRDRADVLVSSALHRIKQFALEQD